MGEEWYLIIFNCGMVCGAKWAEFLIPDHVHPIECPFCDYYFQNDHHAKKLRSSQTGSLNVWNKRLSSWINC